MGIVRKRILLLISAVAVLAIIGIAGWQLYERHNLDLSYKQAALDTRRIAGRIVELRGEKLATLASDYSCWDELVRFVKTRDPRWAEVTLIPGMETYNACAVAVYDPNGAQVYTANALDHPGLRLLPTRLEQVKRFFSDGPYCQFFIQTSCGLLEVRGAKIVPSADTKRTGPSRGYFLVSHIWDSSYLNGLASLIDGKASLQSVSAGWQLKPGEKEQRQIVFRKSLRGADGRSLQTLCITRRFDQGETQRTSARTTDILMVLFAFLVTVFLLFGLSRFVARPLGVLSVAMETQSSDILATLEKDPSEFGRLATLIRKFFQQKATLEAETQVRARAEEALRLSEANFRTFFESITDMIMVGTPEGRLLFTNSAVSRTLGYSAEEIASMHVLDLHPVDKRQEAEEIFGAMFRGERESCPLPLADKEGSLVPVETRVWFGRWNGEDCIFGISKNLTAEQEAQQRFERLFRNNPAPMALSALPERRFTDVNDAFLKTLGYSRDDVIGKTTEELNLFANSGEQSVVADKLLREGRITEMELQVCRKDGAILDGVFSGEMISSQGRHHFLTVMIDITERKRSEKQLALTADRLTLATRAGGVGVWDYDLVNNNLLWDDQMFLLYGITSDQFAGAYEAWKIGLHPDEVSRCDAEIQMALRGEKEFDTEFRVEWPDGTIRNIRALAIIQRDACGQPLRMIGTNWDITERKRSEEALRASEERCRQIVETAQEGIWVIDPFGVTLYTNDKMASMLGLSSEEMVGLPVLDLMVDDAGSLAELPISGEQAALSSRDIKFRRKDGSHIWVTISTNPMFDKDGGYIGDLGMVADITERKQAEEALLLAKADIEMRAVAFSHQATHDSLTGLPNRYYFEQHLDELIARNSGKRVRPMTVLFLDLDKFKQINDTMGHKFGDLLLVEVGDRLDACLRSEDILARMGGDEFTAILTRCNRRSLAERVAFRMTKSLSRPFEIQGHEFVIGASIGLASYPADGTDKMSLLKHADAAMYKAKQAGRGTFRWFSGEVDLENQQRADLEMDIRVALEENQFQVYYQPIVGLKDTNSVSAEALLRWEHPEKGMISPSLFIPVAEEIGVIGQIGEYVLRAACVQTKAWSDEGIHLSQIGVNVSPRQVHDGNWLASIRSALSDSGLDAGRLNLEVTETDFAADYESMKKVLQRVQELGVCMAIDDFGMGQSSLSRLRDFPVIHLKIDGSFVRDIEQNHNDSALVRSIVEMAHSQGIEVTAEWVETEPQMQILHSIGCDYAQGYFISPALSAEDFGQFFSQWTSKQQKAA